MRSLLAPFVALGALALAVPAHAQTEWDLKQAFEGKFVIVKMDMPAIVKMGTHPLVPFLAQMQIQRLRPQR